jgi:PPOX class probable F420-dependent enzyme
MSTSPARVHAVTLPPQIRDYLAVPRHAVISTLSPDGSPHQAIVWYLLDGDSLIINSREERHWPQNLARDDRISVAVQDWQRPNHWVSLKGQAEFLHDGDAALGDIQAMARRYNGNPSAYDGQHRVSFRISVLSTFEYGH